MIYIHYDIMCIIIYVYTATIKPNNECNMHEANPYPVAAAFICACATHVLPANQLAPVEMRCKHVTVQIGSANCRADSINQYEEEYWNITANSTGVKYVLDRPVKVWNYTQCAISDSQFFWDGKRQTRPCCLRVSFSQSTHLLVVESAIYSGCMCSCRCFARLC